MTAIDSNRFAYLPRFIGGRGLDIVACFLSVLAIFATIDLFSRLVVFKIELLWIGILTEITLLAFVCIYVLRYDLMPTESN